MAKRLRGRDLRVERTRAGLSQMEVAKALGINQSEVSLVEREAYAEYPHDEFTARFLKACGQDVAA